ncbi:hypothetical protein ACQR5V_21390 [Xanthomonas oryzae pv. oryzicola]|uniref:hypothetical protein n=1 Tax=Xanthomonas oryzae TaxID=347 RepID=UPI000B4111C4|nr:hypothetical protein [Xanthomonas oryzae]AVU02506.1 hypothetical protein C0L90_08600 [Xanthomonas oryzae pv. oryzae]OWB26863.1 hypothetical protein XocBAI21_17545 [Xanthomonas oryzae pv. oryzicola]QBI15707.1 hypothetical protein EYR03_08675 [Xanthomonas oryzae pv. oryzae]QBI15750.1 hypothetical protein EYR03_08960 [Xanthomonas oryzae pv. oryzae]QBN38996.1 hypothetical protein EBA04_08650 [Xanthomonas oryzae pv. oryzae]
MATEKQHALYLKPPDEDRIELVHADDVEDRKAEGWKEPEGMKANGEEWNREDDLPGQDIAADIAKQTAEADAWRAEQKQMEADAEKAKAEAAAKKAEAAPAKK